MSNLMTEGFNERQDFIAISQRLYDAHALGYETEFMSGEHKYPENKHLRDAYEMGIKRHRDEVRMEELRIG